jgi:predicted ArsR family transcriptional regulator
VSKARKPVPATYCRCSCGWYGELFEAVLGRPVEVELLGSIASGDEQCRFVIHL